MRHTHLACLLALCAAAATFNAHAQRDRRLEKDVVTVINNQDADKKHVEETMKENAPQTPNDNGLPRFALVGKDRMFYLGIGAQFLGEGVFTWGDEMPSALDFIPSTLTPSSPGNRSNLQFAWQSSSIYLNFVAMPGSDNKIGIFFKGNFNSNNTFKCSHFYARYRGLTVGRTNSLFTDGDAVPMTIDNQGPNGIADLSLFTAYWTQRFTPGFSGAIGIDAPVSAMTYGTSTKSVNQRIPAIPAYLQYDWGGDSHIRLSGIVRPMQYRDLKEGSNSATVGGGIQLSGNARIVDGVSIQFSGVYGRGLGSYLQDDEELALDAVPTTDAGKMSTVKNLGLTGGFNFVISPKVSANVVYSHLTNWMPDNAVYDRSNYRYGDYVAANVIYSVNRFVSAGIEYDYGHRKDFNGDGLHANRIQAQLAVTF